MAVFLSIFFGLIFILSNTGTLIANSTLAFEIRDLPEFLSLKPNEQLKKETDQLFTIFCFDNVPKSFFQIWRSVDLLLEHAPESFEIFTGENATEVENKYHAKSMWNPSSWLTSPKNAIDFPAFSHYCVGVATKENFVLYLKVRVINYWKVLQTLIGIILFITAPSLSRNPFFHYTSGISLGVLASLLIVIFIISRFIPQKPASYAVLVFGYSIVVYILQKIWLQFNDIVANYMDILLIYSLCTAFISFIICYRFGPVENVRTFNIIQWFMQILAVILIYLGSEYREFSAAVILILITARVIPSSWISYGHRLWYRFFPPKIRLLTELEYIEQGNIETKKALEELRKFCSSPDCNTWKVVRQVQDPIRFSKFVETGSHYTDEELLRYNSEEFEEEDDEVPETELSYGVRNGSTTSTRSLFNHR